MIDMQPGGTIGVCFVYNNSPLLLFLTRSVGYDCL
jgi:hypothetical protein